MSELQPEIKIADHFHRGFDASRVKVEDIDTVKYQNIPLIPKEYGIADENALVVDGSPNSGEYARFTADGLEGRTEAEFKADFNLEIGTDVLAQQTIGIADDNLLEVDGSPNSAEYARFTANGLEGRTEAEFKADFNLEIGTDVQAYSAGIFDNPMSAEGDTIYGGASGVPTRLAKASDGDVLTLASGVPSWATPTVTEVKTGQALRAKNSTGTQEITHSLGRTPSYIQIQAFTEFATNDIAVSFGTATGTSDETCTYSQNKGTSGAINPAQDSTHIIHLTNLAENALATATLSAVSTTTFTINWDVNANDNSDRVFQWTVIG